MNYLVIMLVAIVSKITPLSTNGEKLKYEFCKNKECVKCVLKENDPIQFKVVELKDQHEVPVRVEENKTYTFLKFGDDSLILIGY